MKNITLAIDDELLAAGRQYAQAHRTTLNSLVRTLLRQAVMPTGEQSPIAGFLELGGRGSGTSRGKRWTRDDLHERRPA